LLPDAFYELTPAAFFRMVRGYYRRLEDQQWEPLRWLGTLQVNMQLGKDDVPYEPRELLPLQKDPPLPPPPAPLTAEQHAAWVEQLDAIDNTTEITL